MHLFFFYLINVFLFFSLDSHFCAGRLNCIASDYGILLRYFVDIAHASLFFNCFGVCFNRFFSAVSTFSPFICSFGRLILGRIQLLMEIENHRVSKPYLWFVLQFNNCLPRLCHHGCYRHRRRCLFCRRWKKKIETIQGKKHCINDFI